MTQLLFFFIVFQALFLIPSYFLYKKFLIKRGLIQNIKTYSLLTTLLMPFLWTAIITGICYGIINPILRSKKFNSKEWISNIDSRYRMVNDLEKNNILKGKTKKDVFKILGADYTIDCWTKNTICYITPDPDNYAILDHYEFVIFFNKKNYVERVEFINR